ncbi:hypothetical protein CU102_23725 [Phyllobacterium brassicacearum]|uniref:Uncharacterized protein n=1 Tax=Phyllobacterium brassicacearum TaxID=314235 RepID=A0A2P7BAC6_9HYPH|nr:hypothetical protein CU102_23725 [Phyllobacterium brassicacearum]
MQARRWQQSWWDKSPICGSNTICSRLTPTHGSADLVKRQKNNAADAEAICEAAMRPTGPAYTALLQLRRN